MNHPVINHHNFGAYVAGVAVVNWIVSLIVSNGPLLSGIASIATAVAAAVSIVFAIRNRKR